MTASLSDPRGATNVPEADALGVQPAAARLAADGEAPAGDALAHADQLVRRRLIAEPRVVRPLELRVQPRAPVVERGAARVLGGVGGGCGRGGGERGGAEQNRGRGRGRRGGRR